MLYQTFSKEATKLLRPNRTFIFFKYLNSSVNISRTSNQARNICVFIFLYTLSCSESWNSRSQLQLFLVFTIGPYGRATRAPVIPFVPARTIFLHAAYDTLSLSSRFPHLIGQYLEQLHGRTSFLRCTFP